MIKGHVPRGVRVQVPPRPPGFVRNLFRRTKPVPAYRRVAGLHNSSPNYARAGRVYLGVYTKVWGLGDITWDSRMTLKLALPSITAGKCFTLRSMLRGGSILRMHSARRKKRFSLRNISSRTREGSFVNVTSSHLPKRLTIPTPVAGGDVGEV